MRIDQIKRVCALILRLSRTEMEGRDLRAVITRKRHLAMALCRHYGRYSWPQIGRAFHRDHTTALYAYRQVVKRCARSPDYARAVALVCCILEMADLADRADRANRSAYAVAGLIGHCRRRTRRKAVPYNLAAAPVRRWMVAGERPRFGSRYDPRVAAIDLMAVIS